MQIFVLFILTSMSFSQNWIIQTTPLQNQLNVNRYIKIVIKFDRALQSNTLNNNNIIVHGSYKGKYNINIGYNSLRKIVSITPSVNFQIGENINVFLTNSIKDSAGNNMPNSFGFMFTCAVNAGKGVFIQTSNSIPLGVVQHPFRIAGADFDNDGKIDLAVIDSNSNIAVLKNLGNSNFNVSQTILLTGGTDCIYTGDVDNDGDVDVAVTCRLTNILNIYKNNGSGNLQLSGTYSTGGSWSNEIVFCFLDNDVFLDAIVTNWSSPSIAFLLNNGSGGFYVNNILANINKRPWPLSVADIDKDGDYDFAVGSDWSPPLTDIYKNNSNMNFERVTSIIVGSQPYSITSNDFNGDGFSDFCVSNYYDNSLSLLMNFGYYGFSNTLINTQVNGARHVINGDFDNDGDIDLAMGSSQGNTVSIFKNNGLNGFSESGFSNNSGHTASLAGADFDNDGDLDLASANLNTGSVSIFKNDNTVGIITLNTQEIRDYKLEQNYPNPFNPLTSFNFSIPKDEQIIIKVYNILGKEVAEIFNGFREKGTYRIDFNASNYGLHSGIYFYRLQTQDFIDTKKMSLLN